VYEKCVYMRGDNVDKYYHDIIPMNLRMTDIQALVLFNWKNLIG